VFFFALCKYGFYILDDQMIEERIKHLLNLVGDKSIGVLGDFCVDCYWFLDDGPIEYSMEEATTTANLGLPEIIQKFHTKGTATRD